MADTEKQYDKITSSAKALFELKTKDYGTAWRILRASSLTDQIFIKASRIRSIQEKQVMQVEESIEGEFIAMINYSLMAMIQLDNPIVDGNYKMPVDTAQNLYQSLSLETKELMLKKNHDYGEAWRDMRVSSMTDLILMKLLRIKQIEENLGQTLVSEGLKANFQDILNYSVFALILLEEENN